MPWQQQHPDACIKRRSFTAHAAALPVLPARSGQPQSYENKTHHGNILERGVDEQLLWNCAYKQQAAASVRQLHRQAGYSCVGRNINRSRAAVCSALID